MGEEEGGKGHPGGRQVLQREDEVGECGDAFSTLPGA